MAMTKQDYRIRGAEERLRISQELYRGDGDKDILNLEYIMYGIMPGSILYNMGCIATLKKAIKLLEKEKTNGDGQSDNGRNCG